MFFCSSLEWLCAILGFIFGLLRLLSVIPDAPVLTGITLHHLRCPTATLCVNSCVPLMLTGFSLRHPMCLSATHCCFRFSTAAHLGGFCFTQVFPCLSQGSFTFSLMLTWVTFCCTSFPTACHWHCCPLFLVLYCCSLGCFSIISGVQHSLPWVVLCPFRKTTERTGMALPNFRCLPAAYWGGFALFQEFSCH